MSDDYWRNWETSVAYSEAFTEPFDAVKTALAKARASATKRLEAAHKKELAAAFRAFATQGEWIWRPNRLEWLVTKSGIFGDDFPVTLKVTAEDFRRAFVNEMRNGLIEVGDTETRQLCEKEIAQWRAALDAAERALNRAIKAVDTGTETG